MNAATSTVDTRASMENSAETERVWREMHERLLSYIRSRVNKCHERLGGLLKSYYREAA